MIRSIGIFLAKGILVITGNLEIAASMKVLPRIGRLPLELRQVQGRFLLQYPTSPEEWETWQMSQAPLLTPELSELLRQGHRKA